jgi:hypothetical protein
LGIPQLHCFAPRFAALLRHNTFRVQHHDPISVTVFEIEGILQTPGRMGFGGVESAGLVDASTVGALTHEVRGGAHRSTRIDRVDGDLGGR